MTDSFNPYQPPVSDPVKTLPDPRDNLGGTSYPRSMGARITLILLILASVAYFTFTVALLKSASSDRKAGMMFSGNAPVLATWVVMLITKKRCSYYCGIAAATVQVMILTGMLWLDIGDDSRVINVNGLISFGFLVLALLCYGTVARANANVQRGNSN